MTPTDIPTAVGAHEVAVLREIAAGGVVLEMGCDRGFSAIAMAEVASTVHSIDWFRGDGSAGWRDSFPEARSNLLRYEVGDRVVLHAGSFEQVLPCFARHQFQLVFFDGSHNAPEVWDDLRWAFEMVRPGGHLAVHDYGGPFFSVKEALDSLAGDRGLTVGRIVGTLAVVEIPA